MNQEIAIHSYLETKAHYYTLIHKLFRIMEINPLPPKGKKTAKGFRVAASWKQNERMVSTDPFFGGFFYSLLALFDSFN